MHFAWIFTKEDSYIVRQKCLSVTNIVNTCRLAQSAERGANNAEVMDSSPISTSEYKLFYLVYVVIYVQLESRWLANVAVELRRSDDIFPLYRIPSPIGQKSLLSWSENSAFSSILNYNALCLNFHKGRFVYSQTQMSIGYKHCQHMSFSSVGRARC